MTSADMMQVLVETTLATSAAIVVVLALRAPVRRLAGWRVAYALWGMVPAAAIAVLLPAPVRVLTLDLVDVGASQAAGSAAGFARVAPDAVWQPLLLAVWVFGAVLAAIVQMRRQRSFVHALGQLRPREDGLWQAQSTAGLPAVVGLRSRIVLPADFETRYRVEEQALVLAHERTHARRGDLASNALATALRCVYWFNPLLAFAVNRFQHDQELACDAAVVALHPASRRTYGEAMLKTELSAIPVPLACQWSGRHPIKERIVMLNSPIPSAARWMSGSAIVLALTLTATYAAWAAQPERMQVETGTASQPAPQDLAELPQLKGKKSDLKVQNTSVRDVAAKLASEIGLRFEGEIPQPDRLITLQFNQVAASSVLMILGAETDSRVVIEGDLLRFVPAGPSAALPQTMIDLRMKLTVDGKVLTPRFVTPSGQAFMVVENPGRTDTQAEGYVIKGTATLRPDDSIDIATDITRDGKPISSPAMTVRQGVPGVLKAGEAPGLQLEIDASADPARSADVARASGSKPN